MKSSKSADAYGCIEGHGIQIADAEQAYIQADMKGKDTWILIPEEDRPKWWAEKYPYMKMPVVLMKASYGHPDAGSYWEQKADEQARTVGFKEITDWPSAYYHHELRLMLTEYADDFKLAGPLENIEKGLNLIKEGVKIGTPEVIDQTGASYLGCKQRRFITTDSNGKYMSTMEYDMKEFVQSCIKKYVELAGRGSEPRHYSTPMLPEVVEKDLTVDVTCPWCEKVVKPENTKVQEYSDKEYDNIIGNTVRNNASKIVMKLLWVARICRHDILKAVTHLASFTSKWEKVHDIKLKRLLGYLARTKDYCLYGWIGDKLEDLNPVIFADSDFAGCTSTRKSNLRNYSPALRTKQLLSVNGFVTETKLRLKLYCGGRTHRDLYCCQKLRTSGAQHLGQRATTQSQAKVLRRQHRDDQDPQERIITKHEVPKPDARRFDRSYERNH